MVRFLEAIVKMGKMENIPDMKVEQDGGVERRGENAWRFWKVHLADWTPIRWPVEFYCRFSNRKEMCRESTCGTCLPTCPGLRTVEKGQPSRGPGVRGLLTIVFPFLAPRPLGGLEKAGSWVAASRNISAPHQGGAESGKITERRLRGPVPALHYGPQATVLSPHLSHYISSF